MRRQVIGTEVGLDFDQPAPHHVSVELADQYLAEQLARHDTRITFEERRLENGPVSRWES